MRRAHCLPQMVGDLMFNLPFNAILKTLNSILSPQGYTDHSKMTIPAKGERFMAVTLEQVEKRVGEVRRFYEACKDALDRTGGDLLEAMIFLERRAGAGPRPGGTFTTERGGGVDEAAKLVLETQSKAGKKGKKSGGVHDGDWREWLRELWAAD